MTGFKDSHCRPRLRKPRRRKRKGVVIVLAAILMVFMIALLAFAIDVGYLMTVRTELQRTADAAALAGAWEMVSDDLVRGDIDEVHLAVRNKAVEYAASNQVIQTDPVLDANDSNSIDGDILLGYLANPANLNEALSFPAPSEYNTVLVRIRYTADHNQPISLFFANVLGIGSANLSAEAAASFCFENVVGFRIIDDMDASLMPFAVEVEDWENLLDGAGEDNWAYDPETQTVSPGSDGIPELSMFPQKKNKGKGKGGGGIKPGNFGTVDIGNPNNAAHDLWRQIREGPSAEDLAWYDDGQLKLDSVTGELLLNGDTGITASMKHAVADVVGHPRTIFLYNDVSGQGNQTWFTIVGFAGVRIMDFSLTGNDKYILVQPAAVADDAAIAGDVGSSYFIGRPVRLVR